LKPIIQIRYFNFFSQFLAYFFCVLSIILTKYFEYFKANNKIIDIYNNLLKLIELKLNNKNPFTQTSKLKQKSVNINLTLTRAKVNNLIRNPKEDYNSEFSISKIDSDNISEFYNSTSNNLAHNLSLSSNNNYISLDFNNLESSNKDILKEIKLINKTKDKIGLKIRNYLILLFITLFNK